MVGAELRFRVEGEKTLSLSVLTLQREATTFLTL